MPDSPRPAPMADTDVPPLAPHLPISLEPHGHAVVIRTPVKMLDAHDAHEIANLALATPADITTVVLDLSAVRIIPSLALGALVRLDADCKKAGKQLKLAAAAPPVLKIFQLTRLTDVLHFTDTLQAALA